ncbi:MAG: hypothetical protein RSC82_03840 [Oscillospiraceae bacterium]
MITVDYAFYACAFQGTATKENFERLAVKASAYLDRLTFDRITDTLPAPILQRAKLACCGVVDALLLNEQGGGVASETNDGISVTYVAGVSNSKSETQRIREAAALFLGGTGLLYRGVE